MIFFKKIIWDMFISLVCGGVVGGLVWRLTGSRPFCKISKIQRFISPYLSLPKTGWAWMCWTLPAVRPSKHSLKPCTHCPMTMKNVTPALFFNLTSDKEKLLLSGFLSLGGRIWPSGLRIFDIKMVARKGRWEKSVSRKTWENHLCQEPKTGTA